MRASPGGLQRESLATHVGVNLFQPEAADPRGLRLFSRFKFRDQNNTAYRQSEIALLCEGVILCSRDENKAKTRELRYWLDLVRLREGPEGREAGHFAKLLYTGF